MSNSEDAPFRNAGETEAAGQRQTSPLSPEEIKRLENEQELEDFMEEPTGGSLSIISDQDTPGEPG